MGTTITIISLGFLSVAASVYGLYKGAQGKKSDAVIRQIAAEAPDLLESAMKTIAAAKTLKK